MALDRGAPAIRVPRLPEKGLGRAINDRLQRALDAGIKRHVSGVTGLGRQHQRIDPEGPQRRLPLAIHGGAENQLRGRLRR